MGLNKRDKISYLRVSDGKVREKASKDDPEAEERYVDIIKDYVYEKVYNSCEGMFVGLVYNTHEEYGTSISMILYDPETYEKFSIQFNENSRYSGGH